MGNVLHHVLLMLAVLGLGDAAMRLSSLITPGGLERLTVAVTLGAAAAVLQAVGLGLVSLGGDTYALLAATGLLWVASRALLPQPAISPLAELSGWWTGLGRAERLATSALAGVFLAVVAWLLRHPSIGFDGSMYHYPEVAGWIINGKPGSVLPVHYDIPFGYYPLTDEVALTWITGIARSWVPLYLWNPSMLVVLGIATWVTLRNLEVPKSVALLGCASMVSYPMMIHQLNEPHNDLPMLAWVACMAAFCTGAKRRPALLAPAIVAAGLALGTKPTPVVVVAALLCGGYLLARGRVRPIARWLVLAGAVAFAIGGVWYGRNVIDHGSPVWPFAEFSWGDPRPEFLALVKTRFVDRPVDTLDGRLGDYTEVLGGAWLMLAGTLVALVGALLARGLPTGLRRTLLFAAGTSVLAFGFWSLAPATGLPDTPRLFEPRGWPISTLRYLLPTMFTATVTVALAARAGRAARIAAQALLAVGLGWSLVADERLEFPISPAPRVVVGGAAVGLLLGLLVPAVLGAARRPQSPRRGGCGGRRRAGRGRDGAGEQRHGRAARRRAQLDRPGTGRRRLVREAGRARRGESADQLHRPLAGGPAGRRPLHPPTRAGAEDRLVRRGQEDRRRQLHGRLRPELPVQVRRHHAVPHPPLPGGSQAGVPRSAVHRLPALIEAAQPIEARAPAASRRTVAGIAIAGIALVYLATRLSFVDRFPYFSDEGTFALLSWEASQSKDDLFISMTIGHPPLHSWLGIPFIKLGFNPLIAMRLVSVTAGAVTVLVVGLLGRRLGGARVGLAGAALCVLLPFFVVHHGIGIIEPLVVALMVSALYLQYELARKPDLRVALLLGLVLAAAWMTKENTKPALVLLPLSLLCFDWSPAGRRERLRTWLLGVAIVGVLVVAAQLVLQSSSLYEALQRSARQPLLHRPIGARGADGPVRQLGHRLVGLPAALVEYISIPLLAAAAGGAVAAWRRDPRLVLLLAGWVCVPFLVSMCFSTFPFPRHIMYVVPPLLVLSAYGFVAGAEWVARALPGRAGVAVAALAVLLLLLPALRLDWRLLAHPATAKYPGKDDEQYVTGTGGGSPWPGVRDELRRRARGQQVVVLHPNANPERVQLLLGPDARYVFPRGDSPLARRAQFAITDRAAQPFVDEQSMALIRELGLRPVARFPRPRGGVVVTLYGR